MKVDLQSIDLTQFYVNEHVLNGEMVYLVIPRQIGCVWNKQNKIFRSSVWNSNGELISASFPKFVNFGENPEVFPVPTSLKNCVVMEKLDGSTLIISKYKGQFIIRTRGTIDAAKMEKNGFEIEIFRNEILPKLDNPKIDTWHCSYIFEWTSPLNTIVINYGDTPQFVLIGCIFHDNYYMVEQHILDGTAKKLGLLRPPTYTFTDIEDLISNVEQWKGKEGVCLYSNNGQEIHKCKGFDYLRLHRMKSELSSIDKVIDVWIAQNRPSYEDFYKYVSTTFDYELAEQCRGFISKIADGYKEVLNIEEGMRNFLKEQVLPMPTRKLQAVVIIQSYGKTNRANFLFKLLDGKPLNDDDYKKLLYQVLKKK